jgi:hypothetical protein
MRKPLNKNGVVTPSTHGRQGGSIIIIINLIVNGFLYYLVMPAKWDKLHFWTVDAELTQSIRSKIPND